MDHDTSSSQTSESFAGAFDGVRVLELAGWLFAPTAGALLADWGAEVVKIENPAGGDNYRGLIVPGSGGAVNYAMEMANRNKKSMAVDLKTDEGRKIFLDLVATADVVITNYLPRVLLRLGLGMDVLREANPNLIIARAHGYGVRGDGSDKPAYDATAFWARGAVQEAIAPDALPEPLPQRGGLGDRYAGTHLAFAIAAALFRRERTGQGSIVDVSLLATALFMIASDALAAMQGAFRKSEPLGQARTRLPNPLAANYRTADGRWFMLCCIQSDRYWLDVCRIVGRQDVANDVRFDTAARRTENSAELVALLEAAFAGKTLAEWRADLDDAGIPWGPFQRPEELLVDPQVVANGYLAEMSRDGVGSFHIPAGPAQFDEHPASLRPAPELGEHTDVLLAELGFDWDQIVDLKINGVVL
jgi:crotonobetainyl-CoA:carnitine CoA-transferase CaiB-like acyl-CoA transferase